MIFTPSISPMLNYDKYGLNLLDTTNLLLSFFFITDLPNMHTAPSQRKEK